MKLFELNQEQSATITDIAQNVIANRFHQIGILPGSQIQMIRKSLFAGHFIVKVDNRTFALRRNEAAAIGVSAEQK